MLRNIRRFINRKEIREDMQRIKRDFDSRTASYTGEDIWDLRDFLMLVNLADNDDIGKAIVYAYKIGFLNGKERSEKIRDYIKRKV